MFFLSFVVGVVGTSSENLTAQKETCPHFFGVKIKQTEKQNR